MYRTTQAASPAYSSAARGSLSRWYLARLSSQPEPSRFTGIIGTSVRMVRPDSQPGRRYNPKNFSTSILSVSNSKFSHTEDQLRQIARDVIEHARRNGATASETEV